MTDKEQKKEIILPESMTVRELSEKIDKSVSEVISILMKNGVLAAINEIIDYETAAIVAIDLNIKTKLQVKKEKGDLSSKPTKVQKENEVLVVRPPIVTVMGHVDHGKTLLLDSIRESNIIASESGGITQHIGAYQVEKNGKIITFLDTPGHEAFTAMRARGASVTDIVILVVAADDKVQPQTIESINYAKQASLPIIVAINKIDKQTADPERIKRELVKEDLTPEDLGGKTICVPVSAKTREGIPELLEMVLLVAEMEELKVDRKAKALGTILESHIDKGKGPVATVLVTDGTLRIMDNFILNEYYGKIRIMENFLGEKVNKACPSTPVIISGFSSLPKVGDLLQVVRDEQEAKTKSVEALKISHIKRIKTLKKPLSSEDKKYELQIVVKTDVSGSLEAIEEEIGKINLDDVNVRLIYAGIGDITESDILMASSGAEVLGFHVKVTPAARRAAKQKDIKISLYKVIYELTKDIENKMLGLLPPEIKEVSEGKLNVLQIFKKNKTETILGGRVIEGRLESNLKAKVFRGNQEIGRGVILNIKKVDKDVKEIKKGEECGISLRGEVGIKEHDIIEAVKEEHIKRLNNV